MRSLKENNTKAAAAVAAGECRLAEVQAQLREEVANLAAAERERNEHEAAAAKEHARVVQLQQELAAAHGTITQVQCFFFKNK